ncbi:MAG: T9SS type A sorting domain-containing protein, partial [Bacteroidetes bacterium]
ITTSPTNRDWNGVMFELQADTSLTLDSLTLRVQTSGAQTVRAFTHAGGLMGQENKPEEWEQLDTFPVLISKAGQWVTLPIGPVDLDKGDTLSLYLHLLNPDADLAYFAPTDTVVVQTPELRLRNSTGVSHTFGQTFNPRLYSGRIFYHFGFKPQGSCRSARIPVTVWISNPEIDLGPDSVLLVSDPLVLDAGPGWSAYQWSDGSMGQTKLIDHMMLEPGANLFSVTVTDHLGCPATDSVLVYYVPTDIREPDHTPEIRIRPNPGSTTFLLFSPTPLPEVSIDIFDAAGTRVYQTATTLPASLQSSFGPAGMYWIHIRGPRYQQMIKWIKIE